MCGTCLVEDHEMTFAGIGKPCLECAHFLIPEDAMTPFCYHYFVHDEPCPVCLGKCTTQEAPEWLESDFAVFEDWLPIRLSVKSGKGCSYGEVDRDL